MEKRSSFLFWSLFISVLIGIWTVLPDLFVIYGLGREYQGLVLPRNEDVPFYLGRVREFFDGNVPPNQWYLFEHKNESYPQGWLAEFMVFLISNILNLTLQDFQILSDFVFPALISFLTSLLFYKITRLKWYSVFAPILLYGGIIGFLDKPIHPQITFPLLLVFLYFWFDHFREEGQNFFFTPRRAAIIVVPGAALGALFLSYFFHWGFILTAMGFACLFLGKDFLRQILILFIGFVIGFSFFVQLLGAAASQNYAETSVRIGTLFSRFPESLPRTAVSLIWIIFFFVIVWKIGKMKEKETVFFAALLFANLLFPNHQIITGRIIQNANHWSFMPIFIYFLTGGWLISKLYLSSKIFFSKTTQEKTSGSFGKLIFFPAAILVCAAMVLLPFFRSASFHGDIKKVFSSERYKEAVEMQRYAGIFDYLNQKTSNDSVVLANQEISGFIPYLTHNNVYYHWYIFDLPASDSEIMERYVLSKYFDKNFFEDESLGIKNESRILWGQAAQSEWNTRKTKELLGVIRSDASIGFANASPAGYAYGPEKEIELAKATLERIKKDGSFDFKDIQKYKLDYIVWDRMKNPYWQIGVAEKDGFLELVYEHKDIRIYKVKNVASS